MPDLKNHQPEKSLSHFLKTSAKFALYISTRELHTSVHLFFLLRTSGGKSYLQVQAACSSQKLGQCFQLVSPHETRETILLNFTSSRRLKIFLFFPEPPPPPLITFQSSDVKTTAKCWRSLSSLVPSPPLPSLKCQVTIAVMVMFVYIY